MLPYMTRPPSPTACLVEARGSRPRPGSCSPLGYRAGPPSPRPPGKKEISAQTHLQVLGEPELGIEVVAAGQGRGLWTTLSRLLGGIESEIRHILSVADEPLGTGPGVDVPEPLVGGPPGEEAHSAAQHGRAPARRVVIDTEPWRPDRIAARRTGGVDAQCVANDRILPGQRGKKGRPCGDRPSGSAAVSASTDPGSRPRPASPGTPPVQPDVLKSLKYLDARPSARESRLSKSIRRPELTTRRPPDRSARHACPG